MTQSPLLGLQILPLHPWLKQENRTVRVTFVDAEKLAATAHPRRIPNAPTVDGTKYHVLICELL